MDAQTRYNRKVFTAPNDDPHSTAKGECVRWNGSHTKEGYARFWYEGKDVYAHRVAFFWAYGYWPIEIDHKCRHTDCSNPNHLDDVSSYVNSLRSVHQLAQINRQKTHCVNGHPFDTQSEHGKTRKCKECHRKRAQKQYQEKRNNPELWKKELQRLQNRKKR